uniref:Uncharacterized protein n=1 Tax=Hyaloperonospora arabidopsidis (strain Emoy2) TaxID=559515 RepID=M4BTM6_HYAAE
MIHSRPAQKVGRGLDSWESSQAAPGHRDPRCSNLYSVYPKTSVKPVPLTRLIGLSCCHMTLLFFLPAPYFDCKQHPARNFGATGCTIGKNTADNGGLKLSFHAYRTYIAEQAKRVFSNDEGEVAIGPRSQAGHDLPADVADKLFFSARAQCRCLMSNAITKQRFITDSHSPS